MSKDEMKDEHSVFATDLKKRIEELEKEGKPKWHKVAEKLPPLWKGSRRTSIRVVDNYDRIVIYDYESERWRDLEGNSLVPPNYWCEIPQFKKE